MAKLPEYIGPTAFGLKMGVIIPEMDLVSAIMDVMVKCEQDSLLHDGDVLCITESIVARAQNNYITLEKIADQIKAKLKLSSDSTVGVVFPIFSRNRFAMILEAIAMAVPNGKVVVQLSWPRDEVGNQLGSDDLFQNLNKEYGDVITENELANLPLIHPITKVNYVKLYREIIESKGAKAEIILANKPEEIKKYDCDGVIAADIHQRLQTYTVLEKWCDNLITLVDIYSDPQEKAWSEWGLLGSNMSAGGNLKLAPREGDVFAMELHNRIKSDLGKHVEILIYGDGAYKDPSTGIYELADPKPVFGSTNGFMGAMRGGVKYKYLADIGYQAGKSLAEIEAELEQLKDQGFDEDQMENEGTTPRQLEDVIASLADLVSGSSDAGTPLVLVKGFFN